MEVGMTSLDIKYLCKMVTEQSHAQNFLAGNILVTQLGHFTKVEANSDPRKDRHEGASHVFQDGPGRLCVTPPGKDGIEIPVKLSRGTLSLTSDKDCYVLCMYAGVQKHGESLPPEQTMAQLRPHPRCTEFGRWVVALTHPKKFLARLEHVAIEAQWQFVGHRLVEYYDHDHTQKFAPADVAFRKHRSFSWQSEYRIVLRSKIVSEPQSFIGIGDISDIALVLSLEQFNSGLGVT